MAVDSFGYHIEFARGLNYGALLFPSTAAEQHNLSSTLHDCFYLKQKAALLCSQIIYTSQVIFLGFYDKKGIIICSTQGSNYGHRTRLLCSTYPGCFLSVLRTRGNRVQ
jgi:hypothetical protein